MSILKESCLAVCLVLLAMANAADNSEAIAGISGGINQFASSLFGSLARTGRGNFMTSPLSQAVALAAIAYGSGGNTRAQFQQVLGLPTSDEEGLAGYQALVEYLNDGQEFNFGNQLFVNAGFSVKPDYQSLLRSYFSSGVQYVNFDNSESAASLINEWIQHVTPGHHGHLKNVIVPGDLDESSRLVLVDAVYFLGLWQDKFNPSYTANLPFYVDENKKKQVATMQRQGVYLYGEFPQGDAKFLVLPLEGGETSLLLVLPNKVNGLVQLEEQLQNVNVVDFLNQGSQQLVNVYLPKLHFRSNINLNRALYGLGLIDVFSTHANLSVVSDDHLTLTRVLQTTFLTVDEDGIDADSGSSGVGNEVYSPIYENAVEFNVNHPFYYAVFKSINVPNSRISPVVTLYTGHVVEPQV